MHGRLYHGESTMKALPHVKDALRAKVCQEPLRTEAVDVNHKSSLEVAHEEMASKNSTYTWNDKARYFL